jgi:hypothetical protein
LDDGAGLKERAASQRLPIATGIAHIPGGAFDFNDFGDAILGSLCRKGCHHCQCDAARNQPANQ